jgi:LPS sulfotransferase NodH
MREGRGVNSTIILATQRTGSTLLCSELAELDGFGDPGEHFLPWLGAAPEGARMDGDAFAEAVARGRDATGAVGLKLMADYLHRFARALGIERGDDTEAAVACLHELEGRIGPAAWFRVDRADIFDQALSRYLATHTGVYFRTERGAVRREEQDARRSADGLLADFNVNWLECLMADIRRETAFLDDVSARLGRPVLAVTYEELSAERERVLAACCAHAGHPPPADWPARWMRKVVDPELRDRFRERAEEMWARKAAAGKPVPAIARVASPGGGA